MTASRGEIRSSLHKLLDIMIERGLLDRGYDGPRSVYFSTVEPAEAGRSALKHLVRTFSNDSPDRPPRRYST